MTYRTSAGGSHSSCLRRRGWRLGALARPAALLFCGALPGVFAEHEQLLEPVLWHDEPTESMGKGLAYNSRSGTLYEVGRRASDINTGEQWPQYDYYMRSYDVSTQSEIIYFTGGSYAKHDSWEAVAIDEENGLAFAAGQAYSEEHDLDAFLHVRAIDEAGGTVWEYQDQGRLPSESHAYQTRDFSKFNDAEYDETRGLLFLAGEASGCLGEDCSLEYDNEKILFVAVALNGTTGDFVWDRRVATDVLDYGEAHGIALDLAAGIVFVGGHTKTTSGTEEDLLITALEPDTGEVIWEWKHGTPYEDSIYDLAFDEQHGVLYACGYTTGSFSESLNEEKYADAIVFALNVSRIATLGVTDGVDDGGPELIWLNTFASGPLMDRSDYAYTLTYDRNGVVHVSGTTQGKGFDTAGEEGEEQTTVLTTQARKLRFVYTTFSLNATDGETLISYQSTTFRTSLFADSVMVPDTTQGDLFLTGRDGDIEYAITYSRTRPTSPPTPAPSPAPTPAPTTAAPVTPAPTPSPSPAPTTAPSKAPTPAPFTPAPTPMPTPPPTTAPSKAPTPAPFTPAPTPMPSPAPTTAPTKAPTAAPITPAPTPSPSPAPTNAPSETPTAAPVTPAPTPSPSPGPTNAPSKAPTSAPITPAPTQSPSPAPTNAPSEAPTAAPVTPAPTPAPSPAPVAVTFPPTPAPTVSTPSPTTLPPTPAPSTSAPTKAPLSPGPTPTPTRGPSDQPTRSPIITTAPFDATFPPTPAPVSTPAPTVVIPPTEAPTTEAPSTEAPSTEAPSTEAPSTEAPSTEAPSTEAPSTEPPTTAEPTLSPTRRGNVAAIDPDDADADAAGGGDSEGGLSSEQEILVAFGVVVAGGILAAALMLGFFLGKRGAGAGVGGGGDDGDTGGEPTSVDGRDV